MHPGISANLIIDQKNIGIIGKINPTLNKDDIYVCEISLNKIIKEIKPLKYKEASKYPEIEKDVAFIVKKDISSETIINIIKRSGGRLLANVEVFDLYNGENINRDEKSIAFKLTFSDIDRTLTEKEVMEIFNKIIIDVTNKLDAKLRMASSVCIALVILKKQQQVDLPNSVVRNVGEHIGRFIGVI